MHVDHDHDTGEVRGLLCVNCNTGLGFFFDNVSFIKKGIKYLGLETDWRFHNTPRKRLKYWKEGDLKFCASCGYWKDGFSSFATFSKRGKITLKPYCIECGVDAIPVFSIDAEEIELIKSETQLYYRYGLSLEVYNRMRRFYSCCGICGASDRKLQIDHCHRSGKVRGLLCKFCNSGLGMFDDNRDRMISAINYIESNNAC